MSTKLNSLLTLSKFGFETTMSTYPSFTFSASPARTFSQRGAFGLCLPQRKLCVFSQQAHCRCADPGNMSESHSHGRFIPEPWHPHPHRRLLSVFRSCQSLSSPQFLELASRSDGPCLSPRSYSPARSASLYPEAHLLSLSDCHPQLHDRALHRARYLPQSDRLLPTHTLGASDARRY